MAIAVRALGTVTATATAGTSVAVPAGTQDGDLLIAQISASTAQPSKTWTSAGWTAVPMDSGGTNPAGVTVGSNASPVKSMLFWRWAGASEPSSYAFASTEGGNVSVSTLAIALSGVDSTTPIENALQHQAGTAATTIDLPAIATESANALALLALASVRQQGAASGYAQHGGNVGGGVFDVGFQTKEVAAAGTEDPPSIALSGTARAANGFVLSLKAAGSGGGGGSGARSFAVWVGG